MFVATKATLKACGRCFNSSATGINLSEKKKSMPFEKVPKLCLMSKWYMFHSCSCWCILIHLHSFSFMPIHFSNELMTFLFQKVKILFSETISNTPNALPDNCTGATCTSAEDQHKVTMALQRGGCCDVVRWDRGPRLHKRPKQTNQIAKKQAKNTSSKEFTWSKKSKTGATSTLHKEHLKWQNNFRSPTCGDQLCIDRWRAWLLRYASFIPFPSYDSLDNKVKGSFWAFNAWLFRDLKNEISKTKKNKNYIYKTAKN